MEPATRKQRLLAIVIDSALISTASIVAAFEVLPDPVRFAGLAAGAGVLAVNLYWLSTLGQTLGKRAIGIRIALSNTHETGGFATNVFKRGFLAGMPYLVLIFIHPILGALYIWTDVLFIFRADRRCVHDHLAGTVVIQVEPGVVQ